MNEIAIHIVLQKDESCLLGFLRRPVQRNCGDEEEEKKNNPHIGKEGQNDASKRFLVHPEEMHDPASREIPESQGRAEEKNSYNNPKHKHAQKQIT
ncbi:MAG TPA: hypothetical protein VFV83_10630, partial [Chthoniobacteraceae bacterium]|nr:hypothetical protein [Chthoniobacteraceae bacterium]